MDLKSEILLSLSSAFSKETATFLMAMLPVFELRLSIPLAILHDKFHLSVEKAVLLSLLGNIFIIFPLLYFFKYFFNILQNLKFLGKFFKWWFRSVEKRSKIVEKWGFWGLVCFVAIPLPGTGAWTGSVAATLFEIRTKKAFIAISLGVVLAGLIVTTLTLICGEFVKSWFTII